jgi:XTP/dITP diphosphohydrolase
VADDSGLEVDYLLGAPGVLSARYAGEKVTYADNNRLLLAELNGVPPRRRQARFRTVIALVSGEKEWTVEGICRGAIVFAPRGEGGFGYDPLFQPEGSARTYAEMTAEEKNRVSHRARAVEQFRNLLRTLAGGPDK